MNFLPIARRELRVRARQPGTYRRRLLVALVATLVAGVMALIGELAGANRTLGRVSFQTMATLAFLYCLVEGARHTADCLSVEKREGTLGLLFLTDLGGFDVVSGKGLAQSLHSFYGILALFPILSLPLLMGGVTGGEFWRMVLVLPNTLFFSMSAGLLVSALGREARHVWGGAAALLAGSVVLLPLLDLALALGSPSPRRPWFSLASPLTPFVMALDANYGAQAGAFWLSVALQHASSWLLLGLASWGVANIRQDPSEASSRSGWLTRWSPAVFARQPNRPLRPEQWAANPVRWLAEPDERQERRAVWLALLIMVGCGLLSFFLPGDQVLMVSLPVVWAFHWYLKIWLAAVAVHALGSARRSGLLELMLVTPLTTRQMVEGNYHALRGLLIKPALTLAGLELFLLVWQAAMSGKWALAAIFPVISGLLSLMADLYAVAWVGLWFGLSSGQPTQAVMRTVGYVLLLPLLALVLAPFCFFFCGIGWPALVGIKDLIFISWARNKLDREFRLAALAVPETA